MIMKLFYIQSPYYWRNLYEVSEALGIETYEILVDNPTWPTDEYDKVSKAKKIRLWSEERYGSGAAPHNKPPLTLGEGGDDSWLLDAYESATGVYTNKILKNINEGDDIILAVTFDSSRMIEFFQSIQPKYDLRLHYIVWRDFPNRVNEDLHLLQYLPFLKTAASVVICNSHGFCDKYVFSLGKKDKNQNWEKETLDCNDLFLDIAGKYIEAVRSYYEENKTSPIDLLLYGSESGQIRSVKTDSIDFQNRREFVEESITPGLGHDNCLKLKEYRKRFIEEYEIKDNCKFDDIPCKHTDSCRGVCGACDEYSYYLFRYSALAKGFVNYDPEREEVFAPINGIDRMRTDLDGNGVRSLILMDTCYLNCKYCINKKLINRFPLINQVNFMELGMTLFKDVPYFCESGGGVTFGGGEPLIYSDYIHQFHEFVPKISIDVETSLNVEKKAINTILNDIDEWIIDIKDMDPDIYYAYTGAYNDQVISNLSYLLSRIEPDRIRCRVPLIKGYNTAEDVGRSTKQLENMGVTRIERFDYSYSQ